MFGLQKSQRNVSLAQFKINLSKHNSVIPGLTRDPGSMAKKYYVYILSSKKNGTLYMGITSNLIKRIWEHKNKVIEGFTEKYNVDKLVYYEEYSDPENAIIREKRLKRYQRQWKLKLIEKNNPNWQDLYNQLI